MRKAVLHIGGHKTGTTAIQVNCYANAALLRSQEIVYPLELCTAEPAFNSHQSLAYYLLGQTDFSKRVSSSYADPLTVISTADRDMDLVLSSENFMYLREPQINKLRAALDGYEKVIVLAVRRQDIAMQALYQTEVIHSGRSDAFQLFFESKKSIFDYYAIAKLWQREFHAEVIIKRYEKNLLDGLDSVPSFYSSLSAALGRTVSQAGFQESRKINTGFPEAITQLIRHYNGTAHADRVVPLLKSLAFNLYKNSDHGYQLIRPSMRKAILDHFAGGNERLGAEFLGGKTFADLTIEQTDAEWIDRYGWEGSQIALIATDVVKALRSAP